MIVFQDSLRIIDRDGSKITITSLTANKSASFTLPVMLSKMSSMARDAALKAGFPVAGTMVAQVILVHAPAVAVIEQLNTEQKRLDAVAADARFREKYAEQIAEAARTGKPVRIDSWSYEGRGEDGQVYVDLMVRGNGTTFESKTKSY